MRPIDKARKQARKVVESLQIDKARQGAERVAKTLQIDKARDHAQKVVHSLLPSVEKRRSELYWMLAYALIPTLLLCAAVSLWYKDPLPMKALRNRTFDGYMRLKPREYLLTDPETGKKSPPPVRIIDLDDESLSRLGQWPWPRTLVAELLRRLKEAGVGVVAFDAVFAEPDRTSPSHLAEALGSQSGVADLRERLRRLPDHDLVLARAFEDMPVVAGYALVSQENSARPAIKRSVSFKMEQAEGRAQVTAADMESDKSKEEWQQREERLRRKFDAMGGAFNVADPGAYLEEMFAGVVNNLPVLEKAAAGNGNFSIVPDEDWIVRRVPLLYRLDQDVYPALALEALRLALDGGGYRVMTSGVSQWVSLGAWNGITRVNIAYHGVDPESSQRQKLNFEIPTDRFGNIALYDTGHIPERFIPAWKVLDGSVGRDALEGTIAFVGTSAAGLKDIRATPLYQVTPGVEVHAQVAEQALARVFLSRPPWTRLAEVAFLVALGLAVIFLMARLGAAWCALIAGGGVAAAFALSWWAFSGRHLLLDPTYPALVVLLVYLSTSLINYLRSEAEKKQVRGAFSRYMSPELVEKLAEDPSRLSLGGETRELTIMFSDIRSFTTISEQFDAAGLTQFINRYLTPMTGIVLEHKGFIDKYIGDCIMAFWNAPLDDKDHARNACRAALKMRSSLHSLNEEWKAIAEAEGRKHIPIKTGIGLNTGPCCVGNLGSEQRFDYSVLGDDVNLASRLEGQSKNYGLDLVIGENTRAGAPEFAALELDLIRVKGKTVPVRIFTLLGDEEHAKTEGFRALEAKHSEMLKVYRSQKWGEAEALMGECRKLEPSLSGLYDLYAGRIEGFRSAPPPADWDGVFIATSK